MKTNRPTTQRPLRKRRAVDEAAAPTAERAEAPAQSLATLRSPQLSAEARGRAALGLQGVVGNAGVGRELVRRTVPNQPSSSVLLQRKQGNKKAKNISVFHQQVFVVRDKEIGLGGRVVADLEDLKQQVMQLRNKGTWTLVLAIHGSEDRVGAQAPPDWQKNAIFYQAGDINSLFSGDSDWVKWRDTFGPNHISLTSCQISAPFERVFIENLTRHATGSGSQSSGAPQAAQGLGTGCKPLVIGKHWETDKGKMVKSRKQFQRLNADNQQAMLDDLRELNSKYGYYGAPPVPDDQILDYYFDETPKGEWAIVTVGKESSQGSLEDTEIPFWNRSTGPRSFDFHQLCDQGLGHVHP